MAATLNIPFFFGPVNAQPALGVSEILGGLGGARLHFEVEGRLFVGVADKGNSATPTDDFNPICYSFDSD